MLRLMRSPGGLRAQLSTPSWYGILHFGTSCVKPQILVHTYSSLASWLTRLSWLIRLQDNHMLDGTGSSV